MAILSPTSSSPWVKHISLELLSLPMCKMGVGLATLLGSSKLGHFSLARRRHHRELIICFLLHMYVSSVSISFSPWFYGNNLALLLFSLSLHANSCYYGWDDRLGKKAMAKGANCA